MGWRDIINDLVCPACKQPLTITGKGNSLKCAACKRLYPVQDDIPVLLVDKATIDD